MIMLNVEPLLIIIYMSIALYKFYYRQISPSKCLFFFFVPKEDNNKVRGDYTYSLLFFICAFRRYMILDVFATLNVPNTSHYGK